MKMWLAFAALLAVAVGGVSVWRQFGATPGVDSFARGNGRIEATEMNVSTKLAGRLVSVLAAEGDDVTAGQVLAVMDTKNLQADLREAEAAIVQARQNLAGAEAGVAQRGNEIAAANALIAQRESALDYAAKELHRSRELLAGGYIADQKVDQDENSLKSAEAQLLAATAQLQAAQAAEAAARAGVREAQAAIDAAQARAETIQASIQDSTLASPIDGRVLYRLAEPGEVLGVGGNVLTLLDLSDVYMTIFLPTELAGKVAIGAEARIVLDVLPDLSIPAQVTFVSPQAQFTPKAVETRTEREKLMFRIKVRIPRDLLRAHAKQVKTGLPGEAWVRLDPAAPWPESMPPLVSGEKQGT